MSEDLRRKVNFYTPNKKYSGELDVQNPGMRTLDLMNSSNLYWKDANEKSFSDSIMLHNSLIEVHGGQKLNNFPKLQLRISDIIFFSDELEVIGDATEKKRAQTMKANTNENQSTIKVITRMRGDSFYVVRGLFYGLFKSKSQQRFVPLMEPEIREITRTGEKWRQRELEIGNTFIGLSTVHIEACSISS